MQKRTRGHYNFHAAGTYTVLRFLNVLCVLARFALSCVSAFEGPDSEAVGTCDGALCADGHV